MTSAAAAATGVAPAVAGAAMSKLVLAEARAKSAVRIRQAEAKPVSVESLLTPSPDATMSAVRAVTARATIPSAREAKVGNAVNEAAAVKDAVLPRNLQKQPGPTRSQRLSRCQPPSSPSKCQMRNSQRRLPS